MMKRTLILISCLAALLVDAQSLVYTPAMPVLDVPFLVTPAVSSGTSVYLSKTESCDASSSLVSLCTIGSSSSVNYNSTTCVYTITSEDLGLTAKYARDEDVPTLYWCKSGSTTYFAKFDISKVSTVSPIVPFGKASTVVFNKATPEGTQVGFYASSSCTNLVTGTSLSFLDSTRSADVTISSGNVAYVCATVANPLGGTVFIPAGALVVAVSYTINGNKGHRYMNMDVSGNAMYPYFSLSLSPDCYPLAQDPQVWSTTNPKLFIQVPKGKYYFCGYSLLTDTGSSDKFGAYIPATDQVEVTEYGLQPHSVYSGMPTTMTFTMDSVSSGVTFEAALFSDTACKTSVVSWSSTPAWNIPTVGTYYACVRRAGTTDSTARSATIIVSRQPTITYSRTPAVRGLALGLTLDRFLSVGVITGGLSDGSACTTLIASGKTTQSGNTLGLQVPLTAGGSVYTCLSTPVKESAEENALKAVPEYEIDRGYSYSFGTFSTRAYALTYAPLRVNTDLAIGLDPDVTFSTGSKMRVQGLGVECSAALESGNNEFSLSPSTTSITPVNFPQKGQWKLCVSEPGVLNGDYVVLRNFVVYGDAEFAPKGLLTGLSTAMTITDIPADAAFYFLDGSRTCSTTGADSNKLFAGVSSTDGAGSVTMLQSKSGQLTACVAYRGMNGDTPTDPVTYAAGEITVTAPTVYPNVVIGGQTTNLNFQVPDASLLKDGIAYLAASATSCASSPPAGALQLVITASSDDALPFVVFSPTTSMIGTTYLVCVGKTGSYVSAGNVR
ncbi:hypothetical protein AGDE_09701 [Angomonas deanei]|uniref:Uncharacterized protein n=1 Tax=Angomonas deanei TaxID=59799 RepID=A0A7G2CQE1_9TRYP|nr:hypothetical protein AGDE_09701 [Angomonas deanei]CAD2222076.1 hypothetical protein, conserved [Angomonas deanei]|eukprot:EPY29924.1 hypothetical protein AGDE_09701 [Angomonas deanei]